MSGFAQSRLDRTDKLQSGININYNANILSLLPNKTPMIHTLMLITRLKLLH